MADNKIINLFGDKKVAKDEEVKYASLLSDFVEAFIKQFPNDYGFDEILSFSLQAWNFALFAKIMPPEEFQEMLSTSEMPGDETKLLHKMLAYKANKFDEFDKFMLDFMIENEKEGVVIYL